MDGVRNIETISAQWRGRKINIRYEKDWLNLTAERRFPMAHLEIEADKGKRLPIARDGYRSHFLAPAEIEAAGGPEAYALAWLDRAALDPKRRRRGPQLIPVR